MAYFDYSHLGLGPGGGSYSSALDSVGDSLTEIMKMRAKKRDDETKLAQHVADQKRLADTSAAEQQIQRDQLGQAQKNQDAQREFERTKLTAEGLPKALETFKTEGPEAAGAVGAGYGVTFKPQEANLPAAPVAPTKPEPVMEGPIDIGGEEPKPPPVAGGSTEPPPFDPSAPPPAQGPGFDAREYQTKLASFRAEQKAKGDEAYAARDKQAADVASFPQRQQQFESDQAAYPQKLREAQQGQRYDIELPGGKSGGTVSRAGIVEAPRQQAADEFRTAQLSLIGQQEEQAKALMNAGGPPEVAARRRANGQMMLADAQEKRGHVERIAASIASGAEAPKEAGKALESTLAEGRKRAATEEDKSTYNLTAAKQEELRRLQIAATAANAGASRGVAQESADVKKLNNYESTFQHAQANFMAKDTTKALHDANEALAELNDNPTGLQGQLALDKMVRTAQGRSGTNNVINRAWAAIPLATRASNWATLQATGHHDPEVLNTFRDTLKQQIAAAHKTGQGDLRAFEYSVGLRSAHGRDPELTPYVKSRMRGVYEQLQEPIPREYEDEQPQGGAAKPQPSSRRPAASSTLDEIEAL